MNGAKVSASKFFIVKFESCFISHQTCIEKYTPCGGTTYCCGDCNCNNATLVDIPGNADPYTKIGVLASTSSALSAASSSSFTSSSLLASTSSPAPTPVPASPVAGSNDLPSSNSHNGLKIGFSAGLSLAGLLLLCAVWYIAKQEHQWRTRVHEMQSLLPTRRFSESPPAPPPKISSIGIPQELESSNDMNLMQELNIQNDTMNPRQELPSLKQAILCVPRGLLITTGREGKGRRKRKRIVRVSMPQTLEPISSDRRLVIRRRHHLCNLRSCYRLAGSESAAKASSVLIIVCTYGDAHVYMSCSITSSHLILNLPAYLHLSLNLSSVLFKKGINDTVLHLGVILATTLTTITTKR